MEDGADASEFANPYPQAESRDLSGAAVQALQPLQPQGRGRAAWRREALRGVAHSLGAHPKRFAFRENPTVIWPGDIRKEPR